MAEYIERDQALSHPFANGHYDRKNANHDFILGYESYKEWLENLPPADVRPVVRGRWIPRDLTYGGDYYVCSVCERTVDVPTAMWVPLFRFCPHCGSDMEDDAE